MLTIIPTRWEFTQPAATPENFQDIARHTYISEALGNLVAIITVISVLSYFIFSFELKSRFLMGTTKLGRYLLMIGFGAIFGSTVMMRFTLLIDRMYFIWVEWFAEKVLRLGG
jgi:hypothetical protein